MQFHHHHHHPSILERSRYCSTAAIDTESPLPSTKFFTRSSAANRWYGIPVRYRVPEDYEIPTTETKFFEGSSETLDVEISLLWTAAKTLHVEIQVFQV